MLITLATAAFAVAPAAAASAQTGSTIPEPGPILTKIGHTPMVELWDGGGGLPYLGSSTSYNAGDWENTLRSYVTGKVYVNQIAKVDAVAERWISRSGRGHFKLRRRAGRHHGLKFVRVSGKAHGHHGKRKPAIVFDVDETALSNYSAIDADNFTFGPNSRAEATNEIGQAIEPTLALYKLAHDRGVAGGPASISVRSAARSRRRSCSGSGARNASSAAATAVRARESSRRPPAMRRRAFAEIVHSRGGDQVLVEDPSGNPVELFQPA